jgi:hypothetical protein
MAVPLAPTGMTFNSLVQDIKDYLSRGNTQDETVRRQIPYVINRAERSLADKLKIQGYRYVLTSKFSTANAVVAKPDGWRNTVSINFGLGAQGNNRRTLRARSYEYIRGVYPNDTALDAPVFYTDYDQNHWFVGPTPDNDYPFEAIVYRLPDLLGESNQQNYLTQYVPAMLLYECLKAMSPFVRNDDRMPLWKSMADDEFANVNTQDIMKASDRAQIRSTS